MVALDGRGTPGRSKAFHDASYGHLADAGCLADHVAALRQLAETRPWMDLDRVGVFGHSGGGFAAVRAMLDFPEVYKVGVALSGSHDARYFNPGFVEAYDGADNPEAWARASNVDIADRLAGKLLLIHGGMDDQVHPDHTLRLADRLIAADKDFELLIVPGAEHLFIDCLALRPQARLGLPGARADGHAAARLPPRAHPHRPRAAQRDVRLSYSGYPNTSSSVTPNTLATLERDLERRRVLALLDRVHGLPGDADPLGERALAHLVRLDAQGPDPVGHQGRLRHRQAPRR